MKDRDLEELAAFQKAGQEFGAEIKRSALAIRTCAENAQQTLQDDVAAKLAKLNAQVDAEEAESKENKGKTK
jgi:uncharacterized protein YjbK